jgi:hypothetical protein
MEETRRAGPSQSAAWPLLHARPNLQRLRIGTAAEAPTVAASMVARSARVPVGGGGGGWWAPAVPGGLAATAWLAALSYGWDYGYGHGPYCGYVGTHCGNGYGPGYSPGYPPDYVPGFWYGN